METDDQNVPGVFRGPANHFRLGFKIIATIALVELGIMLAFSAANVERHLGALGESLADTLLLSTSASLIIYLWVVRPMKSMEEYIQVENALIERVHSTALSAEVGAAFIKNLELHMVLQLCAEAIVHHLDAAFARIWTIDAKGEFLELQASAGMYTHLDGKHSRVPVGALKIGLIAKERRPHLTNAVLGDPRVGDQDWAKSTGMVAFAGYPLIVGDVLVGVMGMFSKKPLGDATLAALSSIADAIAVGIKRNRAEEQAHYLAYFDGLTGLPNLNFFKETMKTAVEEAKRYQRRFALIFVDIDGFKRINDTLGHEAGDVLLKIVSQRLLDTVRSSDLAARPSGETAGEVGRLGGDEFIVLLKELQDVQDAGRVTRRIQAAVAEPCLLGRQEVFITASSGIAIYPEDGADAQTLMKDAETALHFSKTCGTNESHYYSKSMNTTALELLNLDNDLHRALERGELLVHYQPKFAITSGRLTGAEVLVRWAHPTKGLVPPSAFIPLAEASGLIVPIGRFVLREACRQLRSWREQGHAGVRLAVNLSSRQFDHKDLLADIGAVLPEYGLAGESLEVEITESMLMRNPEQAVRILEAIKSLGIRVTIDDFGTGYSSLNYLRLLPLDSVKIDISFVRHILTSPRDAAVVEAIIALSHSLGCKVIAEGAENEEQVAFLGGRGCDETQSFLSGRPIAGEEFAAEYLKAVGG